MNCSELCGKLCAQRLYLLHYVNCVYAQKQFATLIAFRWTAVTFPPTTTINNEATKSTVGKCAASFSTPTKTHTDVNLIMLKFWVVYAV